MGIHKNAVLTPTGREILVRRVLDEGQPPMAVATAMGVCVSTVRKWVVRFKSEGVTVLQDRSSRPHRSPARTPAPLAEHIAVLRRQRRTGGEIAAAVGLSQGVFAARYHIPVGTLRDWEQGRQQPDTTARAYLYVISRNPEIVAKSFEG